MKPKRINFYLNLILFVILFFLLYKVLSPFVYAFLWAGILGIMLWPIYKFLCRRIHNKTFVSLIVMFFTAACILLPLITLAALTAQEIMEGLKILQQGKLPQIALPDWLKGSTYFGRALGPWQNYDGERFKSIIQQIQKLPWLSGAGNAAYYIWQGLETFLYLLVLLFFLLRSGPYILRRVNKYARQQIENWDYYSKKVVIAIKAVFKSVVFVGLGQGLIMSAVYTASKLPFPLLLAVLTGLAAMVPFTLPIFYLILITILLLSGKYMTALFIGIFGYGINLIVDNWVQPYIIGQKVHLNFLAVFLGIIGGIKAFGIIGIFIGPVIINLFILTWDEFADRYLRQMVKE